MSRDVPKGEQPLFQALRFQKMSASITQPLEKILTPEAFQNTQVSLSGISRAALLVLAGTG